VFKDTRKNDTRRYNSLVQIKIHSDNFKFPSRSVRQKVKEIVSNTIPIEQTPKIGGAYDDFYEDSIIFYKVEPSLLREIATDLFAENFIVDSFLERINEYQKSLDKTDREEFDPRRIINAEVANADTKFLIKIYSPESFDLNDELAKLIKFFFPKPGYLTDLRLDPLDTQAKPEGMHLLNQNGANYIFGTYNELACFVGFMNKNKWDASDISRCIRELLRDGVIQKTRISGEMDGYEKRNSRGQIVKNADGETVYDLAKWTDDVKNASKIELYPKQVDGVRFLYQRNAAILGDKTGTGKTIETLVAAKLRAEKENKPILIITPKSTVLQWAAEIQNKLGEDPMDIVVCTRDFKPGESEFITSQVPTAEQMKASKYVVCGYPNLQAQPKRNIDETFMLDQEGYPVFDHTQSKKQQLVKSIMQTDFAVIIIDEAHSVKNPRAGVSQVLSLICPKIPFRWAASATTIANTPMDILNLLSLTEHSLGKLTRDQFEKEYVGDRLTIKDFSDPNLESIIRKKLEKSFKLKEALTSTGAYLSRSKHDIKPDLPPHTIKEVLMDDREFNYEEFAREFDQLLLQYGDNALPKMSKQRRAIANLKSPASIKLAVQMFKETGEPVILFSGFRDVCGKIITGLQSAIKEELDPNFTRGFSVLNITGDLNSKEIQNSVSKFKERESLSDGTRPIFMVISSKKGGTGISLEDTATKVVINDFDWSPSIVEQVEGRAYRISNTVAVDTHYIVLEGKDGRLNPDQIWYNYLREKLKIARVIQDLESKQAEQIVSGIFSLETQEQLIQALKQDIANEADLIANNNSFLQQNGCQARVNADGNASVDNSIGNATSARISDAADSGVDDDNGLENFNFGVENKQASSWYARSKFGLKNYAK
jgi:hypothetical protein